MTALAAALPLTESRVARLRRNLIQAPLEICVERARYLTKSMAAHGDQPALTRMSLALEEILRTMTVTIRDDEIIVGCRTSKLKGAPLFPENRVRWMIGDVDNLDRRVVQPARISAAEKAEIKETVIPFWTGRTVEDRFEADLPADVAEDLDKYVFTILLEITNGIGHFTLNHNRVLSLGLAGLMVEVQERLEALAPEEKSGEKGIFYQAVLRSLRAVINFASRYADLAEVMSRSEPDARRAAELANIAKVCRRVPEHPARSFHEAVQSFYFMHLVVQIESGGNSVSLGRVDQVLYPYYRRDLEKGAVTPAQARELMSLLYLKVGEIWNVIEEAYTPAGEGPEGRTTQNVVVGGMGADGHDATNGLTYIALDAYADVRTVQPNFGVRFCRESPDELWLRAASYVKDGVLLHFFHDEPIVASLTQAGVSLEDARDYGVVGCLEPNAQGRTFGSTFAVQFNGAKCLELALSNGVDNIFGSQSGPSTGNPGEFSSLADLWAAYTAQVAHFTGRFIRGMACLDQIIADLVPSPLASAMIDGPLDKGLDLTRGGAVYNSTGVQLMGFSNVVDSLYAVEQAVFKERKIDLTHLVQALADDWTGAEETRVYLKNKVAKYGNDQDEVDRMAARVMDHFCDLLAGRKNFRGGDYWPGIFSVGFHVTMGAFTAATPDGRWAGECLGNGITPSNSAALSGPTAIMNSVTKLPLTRVSNGLNLNMRLSGRRIKVENLAALIKGYFRRGGVQVQFNMVDSEMLRMAQEKPDQYRDLIVRVSGYSAVFVNLSDVAQAEIINRHTCEL